MMASVPPTVSTGPSSRRLVRWAWSALGLLLVESLLGVGLNLYAALPSAPSVAQIFVSVPLLTAHIALAFFLLASTLAYVIVVRRNGVPGVLLRSIAVFLFVLVAVQEGFAYVFSQNAAFSFGMTVGFVGAVGVQASLLYTLGRQRPAES
jgi:hypothetical protein